MGGPLGRIGGRGRGFRKRVSACEGAASAEVALEVGRLGHWEVENDEPGPSLPPERLTQELPSPRPAGGVRVGTRCEHQPPIPPETLGLRSAKKALSYS